MIYRVSYNQNMDPVAVRSYQPSTRKETLVLKTAALNHTGTSIKLIKQFDAKRISIDDVLEYARVSNICPTALFEQRIRKNAKASEDIFVAAS